MRIRAEFSEGGEVMRFESPALSGLRFVRRPVSMLPPDGMVCTVDDGDAAGWRNGHTGALFREGRWVGANGRPLKIEPTHWTTFDD